MTAARSQIYETDLIVRYVSHPGLVAVSFDLAPNGTGDHKVSVDRGFVAVTDEGEHRRVRVLKVYRIEDFDMYTTFICPLWCWQVAMAGWWCQ